MIKTLLFDLDGTLYDESYPKVRAELLAAEYISEKSNLKVSDIYDTFRQIKHVITKTCSDAVRKNDRTIWYEETLKKLQVSHLSGEEVGRYYWEVMLEGIVPYIDFLHIFPWLQSNFELFLLTDEKTEIARRKLRQLGLETGFREIISSEQAGETKPSQKLFEFALSVVSKPPEEVAMIGDNPAADIKGGNRSGLFTLWLRRGKYYYYPQEELEIPDVTFTNYIQLQNRIGILKP